MSHKGGCYLRLREGLDEYVREIVGRGQALTAGVADHLDYGMRDATVRDLDGNDVDIGQPVLR